MSTERISFEDAWIIFSQERDGWWGANGSGYYQDRMWAGIYSKAAAQGIESRSKGPAYGDRLPDVALSLADAMSQAAKRTPGGVAELLLATIERTCQWRYMDFPESSSDYESECGGAWTFNDGGIEENEVKFCCRCGGRVLPPIPPSFDDEEEEELEAQSE